jgi:hypothetical protein
VAVASLTVAKAAAREVVAQIATDFERKEFQLRVDLRQPPPGGSQAPYLDERGWHASDPNLPILLPAGSAVEVAGVFNYADRGVFLEIARKERWGGAGAAPRIRVRFMAAAGPEKPEDQAAQIRRLIGRVLQ